MKIVKKRKENARLIDDQKFDPKLNYIKMLNGK